MTSLLSPQATLLFGGTFDPIHFGHLKIAEAVQSFFQFASFLFLPCYLPVHKTHTHASANQRVEMIRLALEEYPIKNTALCTQEILSEKPSYTIDTLQKFRQSQGSAPLVFLMGLDAFLTLPSWHAFENLLNHAHFLVVKRAHSTAHIPPQLDAYVTKHQTTNPNHLLNTPSGYLYFFDAGDFPISSRRVRQKLLNQETCETLLPGSVLDYLRRHHLYTGI